MKEAGLDRPGAEARQVAALCDNDGAILVPAERPVGRLGLVEQDRADRARLCSDRTGCDRADLTFRCQQVPQLFHPAKPDTGAVRGEMREDRRDFRQPADGCRLTELRAVALERQRCSQKTPGTKRFTLAA